MVIEWMIYAAVSAILLSLRPSFMKTGVQHAAPSAASAVYASILLAFSVGAGIVTGQISDFGGLGNLTLLYLAVSGVLEAAVILCLFTALSTGGVQRVMPISNLESVLTLIVSMVAFSAGHGLWRLCCVVLVLLGTVLMESRSQKGRGYRWLLFSFLSLAAAVTLAVLEERVIAGVTSTVCLVAENAVAAILLWVLTLTGKAAKSLKRLKLENWVYLALSGVVGGLALLCDAQVAAHTDASWFAPIGCMTFPLMMLFARAFHKEKLPGSAAFGLALVVGGTFGLLFGL